MIHTYYIQIHVCIVQASVPRLYLTSTVLGFKGLLHLIILHVKLTNTNFLTSPPPPFHCLLKNNFKLGKGCHRLEHHITAQTSRDKHLLIFCATKMDTILDVKE